MAAAATALRRGDGRNLSDASTVSYYLLIFFVAGIAMVTLRGVEW